MSYTESDVIERIFEGIEKGFGMSNVINTLIGWYEKEKGHYEINEWDTEDIDRKIKLLKNKA